MTTKIQTVLLTGKTHTTASQREGAPRGDERVDIQLSNPGNAGNDIAFTAVQMHPTAEQLFAGAWWACYTGALGLAAKAKKVALPADLSVDIEVDLGMTGDAYFIQARFNVRMPGVALDIAEAIAHAAHGKRSPRQHRRRHECHHGVIRPRTRKATQLERSPRRSRNPLQ